jgi:hypothetical protein
MSLGLPDYQAAGIVGNLYQESHVNPSEPGGGIAQWIGSRWTDLQNFAKSRNVSATDLQTQLDFLWSELQGGALSALAGTKNVTDATTVFEKTFERAGTPNMPARIQYAQAVMAGKLARGSYNIASTQLALLHKGERVIPAAENFSMAGRYERGSAGPGQTSTIHLHFNPNSIQLNVPAASTASDMDKIAKQFVASLSKPQVLAAVRST